MHTGKPPIKDTPKEDNLSTKDKRLGPIIQSIYTVVEIERVDSMSPYYINYLDGVRKCCNE